MLMLSLFASCSKGDYYNAIPRESTAILRVDGSRLAQAKMSSTTQMMLSLVGIDGIKDTGIDFTQPVYFFESSDGTIGICAAMSNTGDLEDMLGKLHEANSATEVVEKKGANFCVVRGSWIFGYNDEALLVMGPVVSTDHAHQQKRMARYLELAPEQGISSSELFEKLQAKQSQMALIAKATALPKQLTTPFLIGSPSGTSTDDIIIEADLSFEGDKMTLNGTTSSLNTNIDQSLQKAKSMFSGLSCTTASDDDAVMSIYLNASGVEVIRLLDVNADLRQLMGNVEFRQKLAPINGNMLIVLRQDSVAPSATADAKYSVDVKPLDADSKETDEILRFSVNLKKMNSSLFETLSPFLGDVSTLEYIMK